MSSRQSTPLEALRRLSPDSRTCIERLLQYDPPATIDYGPVKQAAVLVALFEAPEHRNLRVLLTTRAKSLRRHPGLTALPGGKVDPEDPSPVHTARREAYEEVDLSMDDPNVHLITTLPPVLTVLPLNAHMRNHIIVTPVVCLITDHTVIDRLRPNPEEVDHIFSHPLSDILNGRSSSEAGLAEKGTEWWPHEADFYAPADRVGVTGWHRMHASVIPGMIRDGRGTYIEQRFRSTHSEVKGLTADVLIEVAMLAYEREPPYGAHAPQQLPFSDAIAKVVRELPAVLQEDKDLAEKGMTRPTATPEWGSGTPGVTVASRETWSVQ